MITIALCVWTQCEKLFWYRPYGWICYNVCLIAMNHSPIRIHTHTGTNNNIYLSFMIMEYWVVLFVSVSGIVWTDDTKPHFDLLFHFFYFFLIFHHISFSLVHILYHLAHRLQCKESTPTKAMHFCRNISYLLKNNHPILVCINKFQCLMTAICNIFNYFSSFNGPHMLAETIDSVKLWIFDTQVFIKPFSNCIVSFFIGDCWTLLCIRNG